MGFQTPIGYEGLFDAKVPRLKEIGIRLVRFSAELEKIVTRRLDGKLDMKLARYDEITEALLSYGIQPLISLDFMPACMSDNPKKYTKPETKVHEDLGHTGSSLRNVTPPADYREWEELTYEIVRHSNVEKKLGIKRWEVWNEPDEPGFWIGEWKDYLRLYEATALGVHRADPATKVGGPSLANLDITKIDSFLSYCRARCLPVDFITWHSYGSHGAGYRFSFAKTMSEIIEVRSQAIEHGYNCELINDEWYWAVPTPDVATGYQNDSLFAGIYVANFLHVVRNAGLNYQTVAFLKDWPPSFSPPEWRQTKHRRKINDKEISFYGFPALITHNGILKPSFNVFKMYNMLARTRVLAYVFDVPFETVAASDEANRRATLMIWSKEPQEVEGSLGFDIYVVGIPPRYDVKVKHYLIDKIHSNGYNDEKHQKLECVAEKSLQSSNIFKMHVELPLSSVSLFELKWKQPSRADEEKK
jgi:hypothetical protein